MFKRNERSQDGFTLIEILVALVVAGVMVMGYVGLSQRSVLMVESTREAWDNINFAQEFLSKKPFNEEQDPSLSFDRWPDWTDKEAYWKLNKESIRMWDEMPPDFGNISSDSMSELGEMQRYTLETRVGNSNLSWEWIAP